MNGYSSKYIQSACSPSPGAFASVSARTMKSPSGSGEHCANATGTRIYSDASPPRTSMQ